MAKLNPKYSELILDKNKKFYQITIYLSPGDCHRYYSPNNLNIYSRIYLPGFLEPVKPSYLDKHPQVLLKNERVTLICNSEDSKNNNSTPSLNPLFITFVGALNVGSINLSFDDFLKTNQKLTKKDLNDYGTYHLIYSDILSGGSQKITSSIYKYYKPSQPLLFQDIDSELEEYDLRDILDTDFDIVKKYSIDLNDIKIPFYKYKERALYNILMHQKEDLNYSLYNSFLSIDMNVYKMKKSMELPKELKIENYKVSNKGVHLEKREEMGWFNFGSTIVLVFGIDKQKEIKFNFNSGDKVKIGQSLFDLKH